VARGVLLAVLLGCLLTVPTGLAQQPTPEPTVEIEDATFAEPIAPRTEQAKTTFDVKVGCDAEDAPNTTTRLVLDPSPAPSWALVNFDPPIPSWQTELGDCPAPEPPYQATVTALATLSGEAPAFEETTFPLEATVQKIGPNGDQRTYGPYEANVTLTPAYAHDQSLTVDEAPDEVAHDGTGTFTLTVSNQGNGEARFQAEADATDPATEVTLGSEELVLGAGEQDRLEGDVALADPAITEDVTVELAIEVTGAPTNPDAEGTGTDTASLEVLFTAPEEAEGGGEESSGIPAPGLASVLAAVGLALARRR
jgi:hypothetical protein